MLLDKVPKLKTVLTKVGTISNQFRVFTMEVRPPTANGAPRGLLLCSLHRAALRAGHRGQPGHGGGGSRARLRLPPRHGQGAPAAAAAPCPRVRVCTR